MRSGNSKSCSAHPTRFRNFLQTNHAWTVLGNNTSSFRKCRFRLFSVMSLGFPRMDIRHFFSICAVTLLGNILEVSWESGLMPYNQTSVYFPKVYFPRLIPPFGRAISALLNFVIQLIILLLPSYFIDLKYPIVRAALATIFLLPLLGDAIGRCLVLALALSFQLPSSKVP